MSEDALNISEDKTVGLRSGDCPEGYFESWSYEFNTFRFKRPKYDCERGFWFCTDGGWVLTCIDLHGQPMGPLPPEDHTYISPRGGRAVAYATPGVSNEITILFPRGLETMPGNSIVDFQTFNVDSEIYIGGMQLRAGDYPTVFTTDHIICKVPIY